ncbi:hypothetical protein [Neorhizobium alkalisoli]|uniref:Gfo/Idh/MocA-like oxidoreductase C-terminal domain-containing protein n=1 Tax=Neorhizobium alkalisoli TaxID=528178 RepID=A0A561R9F8_9HYPH|nr:hypothetical protein [Neorhizobium alkalisoli]TWF59233.1 hypothetical protein FHW37_1011039 [Neorhizobium alkalisoli]
MPGGVRLRIARHSDAVILVGDSLDVALHDGRRITAGANLTSGTGSDPMAFGHDLHRRLIEDFLKAITSTDHPLTVDGEAALQAQAFISDILSAGKQSL